jgi:hypothetical protein
MSRARDWTDPRTGRRYWFDAHSPATASQLELLADVEHIIDMDDILEEGLSARAVLYRLNLHSNLIPQEVLEQKRERVESDHTPIACRICTKSGWGCEGRITRHHFVPRWMMLLLKDYEDYAPRSQCTIPICVGRHRDLHLRGVPGKSIAEFLTKPEKELADRLIRKLKEDREKVYDLIAGGTPDSYEYQLIRDHQMGLFSAERQISAIVDVVENRSIAVS